MAEEDQAGQHRQSVKAVNITCNFFNVVTRPNFRLYKYRVDMTHEADIIGAKKAAVHQHEAVLPAGMFDGTLYFTDTKLAQDPLAQRFRQGTCCCAVVTASDDFVCLISTMIFLPPFMPAAYSRASPECSSPWTCSPFAAAR